MRLVALIILLIPVFFAGLGIKWMRDVIFSILHDPFPNYALQFAGGLVLFIAGLAFIGGFILHRDRKNNKVAPRFRKSKGRG
ncbi:DUF2627 domain-containing protein [Salicibibacter halophilus]|uniref:DUF2627 domain-containing protein n=1 Tax=Salicibibacter halophilus TaxID=2502791 RepID=A0A514LDE4_9BACI|nr:DUF2627 domain-containing protein [Salicibibacter halophilus]QDI89878.1 DUF2627 domain-containing protein [Salicibibacter halophilus]